MIPMPYGDNLKVVSMESLMPDKDEAIIWRGPVKHTAIRQFIGMSAGEIFGAGGGEETAKAYGIEFLGRIHFNPDMVKCGDDGVAFQDKYKESHITAAFMRIAENMKLKN